MLHAGLVLVWETQQCCPGEISLPRGVIRASTNNDEDGVETVATNARNRITTRSGQCTILLASSEVPLTMSLENPVRSIHLCRISAEDPAYLPRKHHQLLQYISVMVAKLERPRAGGERRSLPAKSVTRP